jgi:hypothetical protein
VATGSAASPSTWLPRADYQSWSAFALERIAKTLAFGRHTQLSWASLNSQSPSVSLSTMKAEQDDRAASPVIDEQQERLASILRRVELGDTSVTDEVYWLQMQEDFVTRKK